MGSDAIVVVTPGLDDNPCCRQAHEPVLVEALVAEPSVEALDLLKQMGEEIVDESTLGANDFAICPEQDQTR